MIRTEKFSQKIAGNTSIVSSGALTGSLDKKTISNEVRILARGYYLWIRAAVGDDFPAKMHKVGINKTPLIYPFTNYQRNCAIGITQISLINSIRLSHTRSKRSKQNGRLEARISQRSAYKLHDDVWQSVQ